MGKTTKQSEQKVLTKKRPFVVFCVLAAEQKARVTYDNILRLPDDPDVCDVIKFLREREIVHYQRFGDALRISQDKACEKKNFYMYNPAFDKAGLDCCKDDKKNNGCDCR